MCGQNVRKSFRFTRKIVLLKERMVENEFLEIVVKEGSISPKSSFVIYLCMLIALYSSPIPPSNLLL